MTRSVLLLKIKTFVTNANQLFETEAEGFTFTFQPNAESKLEVEIIEQANDNDQSDEDAGSSIYLPSSKPTPPPSPCAPLSRPTTPPGPSPPQSEFEPEEVPTDSKRNHRSPSPEPKKVKKQITSAIRHALELSTAKVGNRQGAKHSKYFLKGTEEDRKAYFLREDELYNEVRLQAVVDAKNAGARKRVQERDLAREH